MNREKVWREIADLLPEARQEVLEFIQFLRKRYKRRRAKAQCPKIQLAEEAFVGIWRDRQVSPIVNAPLSRQVEEAPRRKI